MSRRTTWVWTGVFAAFVVLALPAVVSADPPPVILDVRLDDDNRAVVTWTKQPSQGSTNVKWTTDRTLGSYRDGSYGAPLADCQMRPRENPARDSGWLYGSSCKGDDVPNGATRHITRRAMEVGVYYFQVQISGNTIHESGTSVSAVPHYSGILKLTVTPAKGGGEEGEDTQNEGRKTLGETVVTGKVSVHLPFEKGESATGRLTIQKFDQVDTGATPAKLTFKDGSVLVLDKRSRVTFLGRDESAVLRGRVWYSLKGAPRVFFKRVGAGVYGDVIQPRAATFTIHAVQDGFSARVRVYRGTITVARDSARVRVPQGFETQVGLRQGPAKPTTRTPETPFWK